MEVDDDPDADQTDTDDDEFDEFRTLLLPGQVNHRKYPHLLQQSLRNENEVHPDAYIQGFVLDPDHFPDTNDEPAAPVTKDISYMVSTISVASY